MRIFPPLALLGLSLAIATPASAQLTENFDSENAGTSALNYNSFSQFSVIGIPAATQLTNGRVDLIASGTYGISCVGGSGSCVDLDGTNNRSGALYSKAQFAFAAGDLVSLSFDLSGNQRGGFPIDGFFAGFVFDAPKSLTFTNQGGAFAPGPLLNLAMPNYAGTFANVGVTADFQTYSVSFRSAIAGTFHTLIGQDTLQPGANDNQGPILDNVRLRIAAAVPEPASWAMMILGFGIIGSALRRRTPTVKLA
jgi:PEP-CTERM motif